MQEIDWKIIEPFQVREWSEKFTQKLADMLENWNYHSEHAVLLACRVGTDADVAEARAILSAHHAEGFLSGELYKRRFALLHRLSGIPVETEREKQIPPAIATCIIPRDLLEKLYLSVFGIANLQPGIPEAGKKCFQSLADQTLEILNPFLP